MKLLQLIVRVSFIGNQDVQELLVFLVKHHRALYRCMAASTKLAIAKQYPLLLQYFVCI